jgi:disulfide bond formation protein DsbB
MNVSARRVWLFIGVSALALLGFAWYLQHGLMQRPCPLCILQRYAFIVIALLAALGSIAGEWAPGRKAIAAAIGLTATTGILIAVKQIFFTRAGDGCGRDAIAEFVNGLPTADLLPRYFFANGGCTDVYPPILGLSVPVWALLWFGLYMLLALWMLVRRAPKAGGSYWPDHPQVGGASSR